MARCPPRWQRLSGRPGDGFGRDDAAGAQVGDRRGVVAELGEQVVGLLAGEDAGAERAGTIADA